MNEASNKRQEPLDTYEAMGQEPRARRAHRAFLTSKLDEHYRGETEGLRADQVEAAQASTDIIRNLLLAERLLKGGLSPRKVVRQMTAANAAKRKLSELGTTRKEKAAALAMVTEMLRDKRELARRQELPIDDQGNLGDISDRRVHYDSEEEQKQSLVTAQGGRLHRAGGEPVDTKDSSSFLSGNGVEIFVAGKTGETHMGSHKIGKYHHSSLLAGADISIGGEMKVTGGRIDWVSNKSGHYRPTKNQLVQYLHWLDKDNIDLGFEIKSGWGLPEGKTAAELVQGVDKKGRSDPFKSFHEIKFQTIVHQYEQDPTFDSDQIDVVISAKGWEFQDGTVVYAGTAREVETKQLIAALKQAFGPPPPRIVGQ